MNTTGHTQFIMTPISNIIRDTTLACASLGNGIESQPLASYIMQTTFLRLTGASEQKLKCISWEIASFDYDFRYEMLKKPLGECSSYDDKKDLLRDICNFLQKYNEAVELTDAEKDSIIEMATIALDRILENSNFSNWFEKEIFEYHKIIKTLKYKREYFCIKSKDNVKLFENILQDYYKNYIYRQRNRYAHNLTSYQLNIPTFSQLLKSDATQNNHFRMFSLLILLDGIFMKYYEKFLNVKCVHSY